MNPRRPFILAHWGIATFLILGTGSLAVGQGVPTADVSKAASDEIPDTRALMETVQALQSQVQQLSSQVGELRAEATELRGELARAKSAPAGIAATNYNPYTVISDPPRASVAPIEDSSVPQTSGASDKIDQLQENQDLLAANLQEQSQTKIESGSKYRVRLSGIVLLNMFSVRGNVDSQDFPEIAVDREPIDSSSSFAGSLRQSQFGLEAFGPDFAGAHTSANIRFDFGGGFPNTPNGTSMGLVRLRTGTIRFDWKDTSVIAGQDYLFFAPLSPTSLAQYSVPALSYAGNIWAWTPQIRVEHRIALSDKSKLLLQAGILDSFSGDQPDKPVDNYPSWGEQSGQPAYAARVAWTHPFFGQDMTISGAGYYGRQFWGFTRHVDGWAAITGLILPLGNLAELSGQFYRGRAVGGLGGAIGQDILFSGSIFDPNAVFKGLDTMGGWGQLKFRVRSNFEINTAFGIENPFASELRAFPLSASYYGSLFSKNISPFANFIYRPRSDIAFSVEYRYLRTTVLDTNSFSANHISANVGYLF